jgi:catechol 2,3-dioxygenase-like lactoylglutathione lyase family enzyme
MAFRVQGLDHVALAVGDQKASEGWYRDVLGLGREYSAEWGDTPVALMANGSGLALFKAAGDGERAVGLRHVASEWIARTSISLKTTSALAVSRSSFRTTACRIPSTSRTPTVCDWS